MYEALNYSMLGRNTFGMDAKCSRYIEFHSANEIALAAKQGMTDAKRFTIVGRGSNLLFTSDFDGTIVHSAIKGCYAKPSIDGKWMELRCGSGETWDDIVSFCIDNGWYGAENLSYIPGEVGATAVQNIGAYGAEAKDLIVGVDAIEAATGSFVRFSRDDCQYGYRQSRFKGEWKDKYVITHVTYRLSTTFRPMLDYGNIKQALADKGITRPTARQVRDAIIETRKAKLPDPQVYGNAGSFFMNPVITRLAYERLSQSFPDAPHYAIDDEHVKIPAGWLIEKCGWKGKAMGKAGVYEKQSLVLINLGGATGKEILALSNRICSDVHDMFGISIKPEVNIL